VYAEKHIAMQKENADLVSLKIKLNAKILSSATNVSLLPVAIKHLVWLEKLELQHVFTNKLAAMMETTALKIIAIPQQEAVFTIQLNLQCVLDAKLTPIALNMLSIKSSLLNAKLHFVPKTSVAPKHLQTKLHVLLFQFALNAMQLLATKLNACLMMMVFHTANLTLNLATTETNAPLTNAIASLEIAFTPSSNPANAKLAICRPIAQNGQLTKTSQQVAKSLFAILSDIAKLKQQRILLNVLKPRLAPKILTVMTGQQRAILQNNVSLHIAILDHANLSQLMI